MADWLGLPMAASDHAEKVDVIIVMMHVLMALILVGWGLFFLYTLYRFRKAKQPKADYLGAKSHATSYIEGLVARVEIVILAAFAIPFWVAEVDARPPVLNHSFEVRVTAMQFAWLIHYPGPDEKFGRTDVSLIDDQLNPLGLDRDDPNAAADVFADRQLHLPFGETVLIHLTSRDVVHSFTIPEFRVKQDAIPGMVIPIRFKPTVSTEELRNRTNQERRNFQIACTQLCGLGHYSMKGTVTVETDGDFLEWYNEKLERQRR